MGIDLRARISRMRHGRGFGVHSPWAYRVLTEVLREKAQYYCYPRLDKIFGDEAPVARALFRLTVFLSPESVTVLGDRRWITAVDVAGRGRTPYNMLIVTDPNADADSIAGAAKCGDVTYIVFLTLNRPEGRKAWNEIIGRLHAEGCPALAIDTHYRIGIVNMRKDMPTQTIRASVKL